MLAPIVQSRKDANSIKRDESITVVIGNPPYKEKAKVRGGWIEGEDAKAEKTSPLAEWMPPREWGAGAHSKHLRNLYIYFWRWATRKVFDHGPGERHGIVNFITVAGFLSGPGFQKMRDYLRRTCDDHWLSEYTTELINLLNVLGILVDLEPKQKELLERILAGELISESELTDAGAFAANTPPAKSKTDTTPGRLH